MPAASASAVGALASADRAHVYRVLARLFRPPDASSIEGLRLRDVPELRRALGRLGASSAVVHAADAVGACLAEAHVDRLERAYHDTFDPSGGLRCSPHETSHTSDTGQQALTRTFELADVAGFYRAFGVEVTPGTERPDHLAAELEFMHLLAVKEALARRDEGGSEHVEICRAAAHAFLRDHLARWAPRFAEGLEDAEADPLYASAGRLLDGFVALDAAWLGAT